MDPIAGMTQQSIEAFADRPIRHIDRRTDAVVATDAAKRV
jgi:hypothetical protein